ncbi:MAG: metallophosphoesterase [Gemmataceae bacterium]
MRAAIHDDWLLTPYRVAVHKSTQTAVIADVHLGYWQARRKLGEAVPVVPVVEALAPLRQAMTTNGVTRLVVAGDFFEETPGEDLIQEVLEWFESNEVQLVGVVPGNHDEDLGNVTTAFPLYPDGLWVGEWKVLHGDGKIPKTAVVHGHVHPCFRIAGVNAHCYLSKSNRLVLPAFSTDASGVNVLSDEMYAKFESHVITTQKVLDFGAVKLLQKTKS